MTAAQPSELLPPGVLGQWVNDRRGIWQNRFLDSQGLARHARDLGGEFWDEHVEELWGLGLLRADLVISSRKLPSRGFIQLAQTKDGRRLYADERRPIRRRGGWGGAAKHLRLRPVPSQPWRAGSRVLQVWFHPYRYYVLNRLGQLFDIPIARAQLLHALDGFRNFASEHIDRFQRITASLDFLD